MLHLNARVHLDEMQPPVLIHQEFNGARVAVSDLRQRLAQHGANLVAQFGRDLRGRRFLQQLLMPPLDGTFALAQADHVAVLVGQHLKLDVPGMLDVLLHVEIAVAERPRRFRLRGLEQPGQFFFVADDAHAASAASRRRLHDHREADLPRPLDRLAVGSNDSIRPRQNRHARPLHRRARFFLLAHQPRHFGPRTNELDPAGLAHFGKVGVFRQQSVAGMHRLDIGDLRRADDRRNIQIAQRQLRRPNADGLIGKAHVQRVAVRLAVNGDRADAQLLARANHAQCNLSAIGNQDFLEHEEKATSYEL